MKRIGPKPTLMSVVETLLHPSLVLALGLYALLNLALAWIESRYSAVLYAGPTNEWISEHIVLPIARVLLLLVFIISAYPVLFGLPQAPSLGEVISGSEHHLGQLINAAFLAGLLLPLLPGIGGIPGIVLPIQGIMASALLFAWLARYWNAPVSLWPGWGITVFIVLWTALGHRLALLVANRVAELVKQHLASEDARKIAYELLILILQAPAILLYTLNVGKQLSGFQP